MTATAVLVHGAWHGAWCYERVVPLLADAGVPAVAIDLPGHGDDRRPLADLYGDAAAVTEVLDRIDGEVVLVGHSYGGAVITEAGSHDAVRHLVYLCAFPIDAGESCAAAAADEPATKALSHDDRPSLADAFIDHGDGSISFDPKLAPLCFFGDCDEATTSWAVGRLGPQAAAALVQPPTSVAWRTTPSTYAVCTEDMAVHPGLQEVLAARCTNRVRWSTSHSPFLSRPELVAEMVADLAR